MARIGRRGRIGGADRPDANRIALRAARSILDAAAPIELSLAGAIVRVSVERLPASAAWPEQRVPGIDEAADGPWPIPVLLRCAWAGGGATLIMSAAARRSRSLRGRSVGLRVATADADESVLWISVPRAIRGERDGARVWVPSPLRVLNPNEGERATRVYDHDRRGAELRASGLRGAALRSGLALASARHVEAFAVRLPEGEVLPLPGDAFARVAHLALLLLPFAAMTRPHLFEGAPPFDVHSRAIAAPTKDREAKGAGEAKAARLAKLYGLPGGARELSATLDAWVAWIREARPPVFMFRDVVRARYGKGGAAAADDALRLLMGSRLVTIDDGALELTKAGEDYVFDPGPARLFEQLRASFTGMLETLVLAATPGISGAASMDRLLAGLLEKRWRTPSQARIRTRWLTSMGLVERRGDDLQITREGLRALRAHAAEVSEIRRRVEDLLESEREIDLDVADAAAARAGASEAVSDEPVQSSPEMKGGASSLTDEQRRRAEERCADAAPEPTSAPEAPPDPPRFSGAVALSARDVRAFAGRLRLPDALLERACAALSSGKHLLFVGPPGTGKTELAIAIGAAAAAAGYCGELMTATATADWTTFDTIGGYALQRAGDVSFRPGVFLRALERRAWLLIDELNRADIDRAFGELLTVLAGRGATTPFAQDDGRLVSLGPDASCSHRVPPSFRLIATMNTWDKASLFRLSFAIERRFATIYVGSPDDEALAEILSEAAAGSIGGDERARGGDGGEALDERSLEGMKRLFRSSGIASVRAVGPAVAIDMIRYMKERRAGGDAFVEALVMFLLPQLAGLEATAAATAFELASSLVAGWASPTSVAELKARFRDAFPLARLRDP